MNCEQFNLQIEAYHDGELPAASARQLEAHLRECPSCAQELRSQQAASRLMQSIPMAEMSADSMARLHSEVAATMDRSLLPWARSLVGIAASILIAATAGLLWMQPASASAPQPWEGAMLVPQNSDFSQAGNSTNTIEPDLIVADLSRADLSRGVRP
jgi:anti-sigma factor RsiW